jgi:hypothetical protein
VKRDRRQYQRARRAKPGFLEAERQKRAVKMLDPAYAAAERAYERARSAKRRAQQRETINERARARHAERMANDPGYRQSKAAHSLRWIKANPAKALANVSRRDAQKLQAMPSWADKEQIQSFYDLAAAYRRAGVECEVDHIVPLRSPLVCGLHVLANLELLGADRNKSKGNRHWPDQPLPVIA